MLFLLPLYAEAQSADAWVAAGRLKLQAHDLPGAQTDFQSAVKSSPTHPIANVFLAITRLALLEQQPSAQAWMTRWGFPLVGRDLYAWRAHPPSDLNDLPAVTPGRSIAETPDLLRTHFVPEISAALENLSTVTSPAFLLSLSALETGGQAVQVDQADVLLIRSGLYWLEYIGSTLHAWDLDIDLSVVQGLAAGGEISAESLLARFPKAFTFASTNDLSFARQALGQSIARYQEASELIRNRPPTVTRLFNWDPGMAADEASFRAVLDKVRLALEGPVLWDPARALSVDARALFTGKSSPRDWLPTFHGDAVVEGSFSDAGFGGLLSGVTPLDVEEFFGSRRDLFGVTFPGFQLVPRMESPRLAADGSIEMRVHGKEGGFVLLQVSTDLVHWKTLSGARLVDRVAAFRDFDTDRTAHRFYRVVSDPNSFTLSGRAFDAWNNRPMAGAVLHLDFPGLGIPAMDATTGPDGRYIFVVDLPSQFFSFHYNFSTSPPGYDPQARSDFAMQGEHIELPILFSDTSRFPLNDSFDNRIVLEGDQVSAIGYDGAGSAEFGEPEHDVLSVGPTYHSSLWWSYTPKVDGTVTLQLMGSVTQSLLAVYTGSSVQTLSRVTAEQWDRPGDQPSVKFHGNRGVEYLIAVDTLRPTYGAFELELRFSPSAGPASYRIDTIAGDLFPDAKDGIGAAARFSGPQGLARNATGNLWVTDWGNHLIREVSLNGVVTTIAGLPGNFGSVDGRKENVRFDQPSDVVFDRFGNAYVTDFGSHTIRKVTAEGAVTTVAGKAGKPGAIDGGIGVALFHNPSGIAITADGTLYVSEVWNHTVRRISTQGVVSTVAGAAEEPGFSDGPGPEARFDMPVDLEADAAGNLYVADLNNHLIRRITPGGRVDTIAGQPHTAGSIDGNRGTALLESPYALALDSLGNLGFVQGNHTVRRLTPAGDVITLAGLASVSGSADGTATRARFRSPSGIVSDGQGGWWIDDFGNNAVRRLTAAGQVTTLAGLAVTNASDGIGAAARFNGPAGVALEASGSLIVGDWNNQTIRRIYPSGEVVTLAGMPGARGVEDGHGAEARFTSPADVAVSPDGTIVVAEWENHLLRRITPDGTVSTLAGDPAISGSEDGTGPEAHFVFPSGLCVDGAGTVYLADAGAHLIRRVTSKGVVTTVAGSEGVSGSANGNALDASFSYPSDVAIDEGGNLYVADSGNHVIRKIAPDGTVSTFAGAMGASGGDDGPRLAARFSQPSLLAFGPEKALFVVEASHTLRRISAAGLVQTLAGSTGEPGYFDGAGTAARFRFPSGLAVGADGTAWIADYGNNVIRAVPALGDTWTLAGLAVPGAVDGVGNVARFDGPSGLAVDSSGALYVADWNNSTLRNVSPNGAVTTVAGSAGHPGISDGAGRLAQFVMPADVVLDSHGNAFVVDAGAHTVRKVTPQGEVTTFAGKGGEAGSADGGRLAARFNSPGGIGIGTDDTLYIADSANHTVRKIEPSGLVSTVAGRAEEPGNVDGWGLEARFTYPADVVVDSQGNLYVADAANNSIRKITTQGQVVTLAGYRGRPGTADGVGKVARFRTPLSLAIDPSGDLIVADYLNLTLRRVSPSGEVSTIAGFPGAPSLADGSGPVARFKAPGGIAIDAAGQIYISDYVGNVIRKGKVTP